MNFVYFTDRDLGIRFPEILRSAGLTVERHVDHFAPETPHEVWLQAIGERGWIALTHNRRIRYTPNERDAVMRRRVALLVIVGTAPYPDLAHAFVATVPRIERFLASPGMTRRSSRKFFDRRLPSPRIAQRRLDASSFGIRSSRRTAALKSSRPGSVCLPAASCAMRAAVASGALCGYAQPRSWLRNGVERMRLPVAYQIALATAGGVGGPAGSPMPPHFLPPEDAKCTSTSGIWSMRSRL